MRFCFLALIVLLTATTAAFAENTIIIKKSPKREAEAAAAAEPPPSRTSIDFSTYSCNDLVTDLAKKREDAAVYVLLLKVFYTGQQGQTKVDLDEASMTAWGEKLGAVCIDKNNALKPVLTLLK